MSWYQLTTIQLSIIMLFHGRKCGEQWEYYETKELIKDSSSILWVFVYFNVQVKSNKSSQLKLFIFQFCKTLFHFVCCYMIEYIGRNSTKQHSSFIYARWMRYHRSEKVLAGQKDLVWKRRILFQIEGPHARIDSFSTTKWAEDSVYLDKWS